MLFGFWDEEDRREWAREDAEYRREHPITLKKASVSLTVSDELLQRPHFQRDLRWLEAVAQADKARQDELIDLILGAAPHE